jgi:hypothetical protein
MMKMMERRNRQSAAPALAWALLGAVLFVLPLLTACGGASPAAGQTVEVHLNEGQIQMPSTVAPGKTVFKVVNDGNAIHGFEIQGPGGEKSVPSVNPGQTASLEMILDPGTYRVASPVDQGMQKALNVSQG